ncbi:caspase family protein [Methylomonas sp. BW4-1]|uniref:caspase family protein n=1 Tax=Methylomonas sp. BW4-1 TaxID=3376685 RepID=UPI004041C368
MLDTAFPTALVIGVDKYKEYRSLKGATADAMSMVDWLANSQGLPDTNITCLLSQDTSPPYVPIAQQVHDWLDMLDDEANSKGDQNFPLGPRVYVIFAGHGYNAATAQQTAIFPKTSKTYWDVIPIMPVKTYLEMSAYFKEVVIICDACRDVIDFAPEPGWTRRMDSHPNSPQVKVFQAYGSKAGQKSKEKDFGNGLLRGVMSYAFLRGVTGAARDANGIVTGVKLKNFIKSAVIEELGEEFKPEIIEDDFVMCNAGEVATLLHISPKSETTGLATLKFHEDNQTVQIDLGKGEQVFEVPIGKYTLTTPLGIDSNFAAIWETKNVNI